MAKLIDLRTYLLLERAFVRRLQRSWQQQSAKTYAAIAQACVDHQWDTARRLVSDLDMTEVGTENREWITYMLLSCAVFGASMVSKHKPSFVGVGSFDTFLKQVTTNFLMYLEHGATRQVQAEALQSIAEDEAKTKAPKVAFDPNQPRDAAGRWSQTGSAAFKAWFGHSKVVDQQGRPLVVYKGMNPYDYRLEGKGRDWQRGPLLDVIQRQTPLPDFPTVEGAPPVYVAGFFSDQASVASEFMFKAGALFPVYLSIQRPFEIDAAGEFAGRFQFGKSGTPFREAILSGQYDGVIIRNTKDEGTVYIPLKPEQIKSAIANQGAFDPNDPRITKYDPQQPRDAKGQWVKTALPAEVRETLDFYGFPGTARHLNQTLRAGRVSDPWPGAEDLIAKQVRTLDALMQPDDATTLHRVVDAARVEGVQVGDTYEEAGYTATLKTPEDLGQFEGRYRTEVMGPSRRIEIRVPKGQPRLDTDRYLPGPYLMGPAAGEVILPRGTKFRVVATTPTVVVEVVPTPDPRITKYDPAQPRDKEGQWTRTGASRAGFTPEERAAVAAYAMEGGGGPERAKWETLNKAVIAADDAEYEAREKHAVLRRYMVRTYGDTWLWPTKEWGDPAADPAYPAYVATKKAFSEAQKARREATLALNAQAPAMRQEVVTTLATDVAERMHVSPTIIDVVNKEAPSFTVGDKEFTEAAHYTPSTGRVELNAQQIDYGHGPTVKGIVAHELSHHIYHTLKSHADVEFQKYLAKATTPAGDRHTDWYHERFAMVEEGAKRSMQLKPEYYEEFAREYPASAVLATLAGGKFFTGLSREMIAENGHSAYAKSYWAKQAITDRGYESAINETMAEVTRYITHPRSWDEETTPLPTSPWVKLTKAMHEWYADREDRIEAASRQGGMWT